LLSLIESIIETGSRRRLRMNMDIIILLFLASKGDIECKYCISAIFIIAMPTTSMIDAMTHLQIPESKSLVLTGWYEELFAVFNKPKKIKTSTLLISTNSPSRTLY